MVQVCLKITEALRMLIGYARVSKTEQNLDLQIDALKAAGCDPRRIFTDKQSGAKWDRRGLDAAMSHLREGDTLVVWKMDRLAARCSSRSSSSTACTRKGSSFAR